MPAALRNLTGGQVMTPIGSNLDSAPMVVGKIQIDATVMLRDADVDRPPGPVKLSPGLKQIEGRADRSSARGCACGFVIFPPQPGPKTATANRPGLSVPIDHEIHKRGTVGCGKRVGAEREIGEHIGRRYAGALLTAPSDFNAASIPFGLVLRLGRSDPSLRRVFLHSLRATLTGSMPACFHHARSSLTR